MSSAYDAPTCNLAQRMATATTEKNQHIDDAIEFQQFGTASLTYLRLQLFYRMDRGFWVTHSLNSVDVKQFCQEHFLSAKYYIPRSIDRMRKSIDEGRTLPTEQRHLLIRKLESEFVQSLLKTSCRTLRYPSKTLMPRNMNSSLRITKRKQFRYCSIGRTKRRTSPISTWIYRRIFDTVFQRKLPPN